MANSFLPPVDAAATASTEGQVIYVESGDLLLTAEAGEAEMLVTLSVPVSVLRALRAALNHPRIVEVLEAAEPASPPVA